MSNLQQVNPHLIVNQVRFPESQGVTTVTKVGSRGGGVICLMQSGRR